MNRVLRQNELNVECVGGTEIPGSAPPGPRSSPRVKTYTELDGGLGPEVNFRPHRYQPSELGPIGATVRVNFQDTVVNCELHDVSQNGVAFEWCPDAVLRTGDTIPLLTVTFDQHEAYRGAARVRSVRRLPQGLVVGVSFLDTLMNIDHVLQLRDVKAWKTAGPGLSLAVRPWRVPGHERFKALVGELRLLFVAAHEQLSELEASLPWHLVHGDHENAARAALVERVRADVVEEIVRLYVAVGNSFRPGHPEEHQALKEYSRGHLHAFFMASPWVRRALEKPLGYPGDYELMNGLYNSDFSGPSLFAKAVNLAFVSVPAARAVRERKNVVKQRLADLIRSRPDQKVRILSIAAGPAQEVYELLLEQTPTTQLLEIVLFDQDQGALTFAYGRLKALAEGKWANRVQIVYLHDTIKRLLRDPRLFEPFHTFDAIFSCGLFDYLPAPAAISLTKSLYSGLAPKGTLYIGNQVPASSSRWAMECHCDWYLNYREREEMVAFAREAAPDAAIDIVEESTRLNPLATLTRE